MEFWNTFINSSKLKSIWSLLSLKELDKQQEMPNNFKKELSKMLQTM
jgi:hypothetical protein